MPRTPTRIVGPAQVATGPTTVYTVPANTKTILRHLHISNPSASAVTLTISIGADAAGTRLVGAYSIPGAGAGIVNSQQDWYWYIPMEETEILQLSAGTNNILTITIGADVCTLG
jgi:hypothetical protein